MGKKTNEVNLYFFRTCNAVKTNAFLMTTRSFRGAILLRLELKLLKLTQKKERKCRKEGPHSSDDLISDQIIKPKTITLQLNDTVVICNRVYKSDFSSNSYGWVFLYSQLGIDLLKHSWA